MQRVEKMRVAVPSIDIFNGNAVRLRQGRKETAEVLGVPLELAKKYEGLGFPIMHVVDLGAAFGEKSQLDILAQMAGACKGMEIQWAGGIRSRQLAGQALSAGADRVVFGTALFESTGEVTKCVEEFGAEKIWASLDFAGNPPLVRLKGWLKESNVGVEKAAALANECGVGGIVVGSVDADGMGKGPNLQLLSQAVENYKGKIWLAGGMRSAEDAKAAFSRGAEGAIFGRALYGNIDLGGLACLQKE